MTFSAAMSVSEQAISRWWNIYHGTIKEDLSSLYEAINEEESPDDAAAEFVKAYDDTAALDRSELTGYKSVDTLRSAHDACKAYVDGRASKEDVISALKSEVPRRSTLDTLQDLLLYVVLVTTVMTSSGQAFADDPIPPADLKPVEVTVQKDLVKVQQDIFEQAIEAQGSKIFTVPKGVLTALAEQLESTGKPGGLYVGDAPWLDNVDFTRYALSIMEKGYSLQTAMRAQQLIQTEQAILVSNQAISDHGKQVVLHEVAHRVIDQLPAGQKEVLRDARKEILEHFSETSVQRRSEVLEEVYRESYMNIVFSHQVLAVTQGNWTEIWAFLAQENAFSEQASNSDVIDENAFFTKLHGLSDDNMELAQKAIIIMQDVQSHMYDQVPDDL
jgi:hypothetical protein